MLQCENATVKDKTYFCERSREGSAQIAFLKQQYGWGSLSTTLVLKDSDGILELTNFGSCGLASVRLGTLGEGLRMLRELPVSTLLHSLNLKPINLVRRLRVLTDRDISLTLVYDIMQLPGNGNAMSRLEGMLYFLLHEKDPLALAVPAMKVEKPVLDAATWKLKLKEFEKLDSHDCVRTSAVPDELLR